MFNKFKYILLIIPYILSSCVVDEIVVRPGPCDSDSRPEIRVKHFIGDTIIYSDTILTYSRYYIEAANSDYYNCFWLVGEENEERSGNPLKINFYEPVGNIYLSLRRELKKSFQFCSTKTKYDTIGKFIRIKDHFNALILGTYKGVHIDNPNDSFEISIFEKKGHLIISNINKGCPGTMDGGSIYSTILDDRQLWYNTEGGNIYALDSCFSPKGYAYLSEDNNHITFDYTSGLDINDFATRKRFIFKGKRIIK